MVSRTKTLSNHRGQMLIEIICTVSTLMLFVYLAFTLTHEGERSQREFRYEVQGGLK